MLWHHSSFMFYRRYKISRGTPSSMTLNIRGGKILQIYRPLSRKRYKIGPELLRNTNRKSWVADQFVSVPMTLSDLERRDANGQTFWRISVITHQPFDVERPDLPFVTLVGDGRVSRGQSRPYPKGTGYQRAKKCWDPTCAHTV